MTNEMFTSGDSLSSIYEVTMEDVEAVLREMGVGFKDIMTGKIYVVDMDYKKFKEAADLYKRSMKVYEAVEENPGITRNKICDLLGSEVDNGDNGYSRSSVDIMLRILTEKYPNLYEDDPYGLYLGV